MGRPNLSVKLDCQFLEHNKCSITAKIVPKSMGNLTMRQDQPSVLLK